MGWDRGGVRYNGMGIVPFSFLFSDLICHIFATYHAPS